MVQIRVKQEGNISAAIRSVEKELKDEARATLRLSLKAFHQEVLARTPVYTGTAIANFQWSINAPATGLVAPDETAKLTDTNKLPLGSESRRAANENIADRSFAALDLSDPFVKIYLTNNAPHYNDLEYGRIPSDDKHHPRTPPGGIMRAAARLIRTKRSY